MTQGRDGISLAHTRALWLRPIARRLSVVAGLFAIAALVAGTAGTSYAKHNKSMKKSGGPALLDTVVVSNYGAAFGGGITTYLKGTQQGGHPQFWIRGTNTLLGTGTGPEGDSVSSLDAHIAAATPIDLLDLTGFGGFPAVACTGPGMAGKLAIPCCTGAGTAVCNAGTGFAEIFSPGATGNSAPENIIGTRNETFAAAFVCTGPGAPLPCCTGPAAGATCTFNVSGVNTPQGAAYANPFNRRGDAVGGIATGGISTGADILAISNTLPTNFFSTTDFLDGTNGGAACNAFGSGTCTGPGAPLPCCTGVGTGTCAGFTVGTITEYNTEALAPGFNDENPPFDDNPVCTLPAVAIPPGFSEPPSSCPEGSISGATIGGCLTFLLGPTGLAFDANNFLFVVNEAGVASGAPGFVNVYKPGASGDAFPAAIIGLIPEAIGGTTPPGTFKDPAYVTVDTVDFEDDVMFVSDVGDNSIKIFDVFTNFNIFAFVFTGTELGTIQGGSTKLKRPEGLALSVDDDALYVANNANNTLSMFTDILSNEGGGNLAPTLILKGKSTKLDLPVGVALPQFMPAVSTHGG